MEGSRAHLAECSASDIIITTMIIVATVNIIMLSRGFVSLLRDSDKRREEGIRWNRSYERKVTPEIPYAKLSQWIHFRPPPFTMQISQNRFCSFPALQIHWKAFKTGYCIYWNLGWSTRSFLSLRGSSIFATFSRLQPENFDFTVRHLLKIHFPLFWVLFLSIERHFPWFA